MQNGNSLLSRLLKARYFKHTDFVGSYRGHNPSYTWRSIWGAKALLLDGIKWRVGNGLDISVWDDAWLPGPSLSTVPEPLTDFDPSMRVVDLIDVPNKRWDLNKVIALFNDQDKQSILSINLSERLPCDKRFWWPNPKGHYTVKSGYWLAKLGVHSMHDRAPSCEEKFWKKIWHADVPPKLKHFVWSATSRCLAVKENLSRRQICEDDVCQLCSCGAESEVHALFDCTLTQRLWSTNEHLPMLLNSPADALIGRILWCFENMSTDEFWLICTMMWAAWMCRNKAMYEGVQSNSCLLRDGFLHLVKDYKAYQQGTNAPMPACLHIDSRSDWQPPGAGRVKMNCDAAILEHQGAGLGVVMRDERGKIILAAVKRMQGYYSPRKAEAEAILYGLSIARDHHIQAVDVETDSLSVALQVCHPSADFSPMGLIFEDIKTLANLFASFSCNHVKRVGNSVAHLMARLSPLDGTEFVFHDNFPQGIIALAGLDYAYDE